MNKDPIHEALLNPTTYPENDGPIICRETHISRLYFTPEYVYKIKKPVDLGFLNFTSLERRRHYCLEEIRLNSRLCPETYLGVVEFRRGKQGFGIGTEGKIVEYAVKMRRLPADRMLDRQLCINPPDLPANIQKVAHRLAVFHAGAQGIDSDTIQVLQMVQLNWRENFSQAAIFCGDTLSSLARKILEDYVEAFLQTNGPIIEKRQAAGFIRDGHGDLHAEHICLTDPICIYDCIEFNDRFRIGDVTADLAFLLMDLDFRGRPDLSSLLWQSYIQEFPLGEGADTVLPFFKIYRAFVRGKVNSILSKDQQADNGVREEAKQLARRYFNLALGYLCPQCLILTCGLMGVGKSTLARALSAAINASHLQSDLVRKEMADRPLTEHVEDPFGQGIYSATFSQKTYDILWSRASENLSQRQSVVVDASFSKEDQRLRFLEEAEKLGIPAFILDLRCPTTIALNRLDERWSSGRDVSDGRSELYHGQAEQFEHPGPGNNVFRVDTTEDVDYNVQTIICSIIAQTGRGL